MLGIRHRDFVNVEHTNYIYPCAGPEKRRRTVTASYAGKGVVRCSWWGDGFRCWRHFVGRDAMPDLSPESAPKRTSANAFDPPQKGGER